MADSSGDKKHSATDRKRRQAREKGQVVKSQDLTSAALLLAGLGVLWSFGGTAAESLGTAIADGLSVNHITPFGTEEASNYLVRLGGRLAMAVVPILLAMMLAGVVINVTQTGIVLSPAKLVPKLSHISPLAGAKRILSLQGVMRLGFGMFKVSIIAAVAYGALNSYRESVMSMAALSIPRIAKSIFESLIGTCVWIGGALFVLALLEWAFQKWKFEQDLMMSDQEIRDEMKETEGDPQMAQRRRQVQRQMAMNRISAEVPKADFVNTNPTELAIAIKYDPATMPAPIVVAKGSGTVAQRIRRLALENGIPVVERKELAQFLFKNVEVGQEIPPDQYEAVAEVLRYVYQMKGKELPSANAA